MIPAVAHCCSDDDEIVGGFEASGGDVALWVNVSGWLGLRGEERGTADFVLYGIVAAGGREVLRHGVGTRELEEGPAYTAMVGREL